ncbi:MAG: hypothetical protein Kilf2KO_47580 [Rhodospirillales bacterium]
MDLTAKRLSDAKLIVVHVPKAGGSSLYWLAQELFGEEQVLRFFKRPGEKTARGFESLTAEERARYRVFQGHIRYGAHRLFEQPCLYIAVVRDPIDRMMSAYYYKQDRGQPLHRERANRLSLRDYVAQNMERQKPSYGGLQMSYLTRQTKLARAKPIIESDYLLACTTEQLNAMQAVLLRLYGRPDLAPLHRNVTQSVERAGEDRAYLLETYGEFFKKDFNFVNYIHRRFDSVFSKLMPPGSA